MSSEVKTKTKTKSKKVKQEFSYCIGRPWYPEDPNSPISTYTYGSAVFHGTMEQAIKSRDFINGLPDNKGEEYQVYMLVKIPE